jgi:hypothetical protein
MEQHFKVRILDEAITEAVRLSARYISGRQLPDKAIGVLDTACAKVALGQNATPARSSNAASAWLHLQAERAPCSVEAASGAAPRGAPGRTAGQAQALEAVPGHAASALRGRSAPGGRDPAPARPRWPGAGARKPTAEGARSGNGRAHRPPSAAASELTRASSPRCAALQGDAAAGAAAGGRPRRRRDRRGLDRHSAGQDGQGRIRTVLDLQPTAAAARDRPGPCARTPSPSACAPRAPTARRPQQAQGRVPVRRPLGRRQDRDRAGAGRRAVRRRAQAGHHQHERVPGGAQRLRPEGLARRATWATAKAAC